MHLSFIKNKMLTLFAAIGVIITLLPFSLEAGILGQWCSNENNLSNYRYRCGSFWQVLDCQSYYDNIYQQCLYQNKSCCNPSNKSSENPYDVELTEKVGPDVVKAFTEIEQGLPRPNVRKPKPFENDGRNGATRLPKEDENGNSISYTEHTVNPRPTGKGLDGKRIIEGSDGSMWYTPDHMTHTWIKLK
jgi:hypothetical protein